MIERLTAEFLKLQKEHALEAVLDLHNNGGNAPKALRDLAAKLTETADNLEKELAEE